MTLECVLKLWETAAPVPYSHPNFNLWRVSVPNLRMDSHGPLLIAPLRDSERPLQNLAFIDVLGCVHHLMTEDVSGQYFALSAKKEEIGVAAGLVRGAKYCTATGNSVAVAFTAENLSAVAVAMRGKYPSALILMDSDLDVAVDSAAVKIDAKVGRAVLDVPVESPVVNLEEPAILGLYALKLLQWVQRKALTEVTRKQALQLGPGCVRSAATAAAAIDILVHFGWLLPRDRGRYQVAPPP